MNGACHQLFPGSAFSRDQHSARLRRHRLDQVKYRPHLGALPDDVVQTREPPQFPFQVSGLLLPLQALGNAAYRPPQLVHQVVVLDDVAVRARIDGRDRRIQRRNARHQQKKTVRCDLLGELQKIHAVFARHFDVGNHDIENLGLQFALGGLRVVRHFDAVPFLAEGDFQQLANGALVVHYEDVRHLAAGLFCCG